MTRDESWPITFGDVEDARQRISHHLNPTPLRNHPVLDQELGMRVLLKHENHQPTNSFKVRNGTSALSALSDEEKGRGVVAATRGNHGLGLAWAGSRLGIHVTICVPVGNNPEKIADLRALGADVREEGRDYDEALEVMRELEEGRGLIPIHSTNNAKVVAGAGTLTLEIVEQVRAMEESLDAIVYSVGGGSQSVGGMTVIRELCPEIPVFGVQAAGASAIHDSWHAGERLSLDSAETIADGLATRTTYDFTFGALREGLSDFVLVSEEDLAQAVSRLLRTTHNLAEPAGAAGIAGAARLSERLAGKTVAVVLSGGNIDAETLRNVIVNTGQA